MVSLLNKIAVKSGLLDDMGQDTSVKWFQGVNGLNMIVNFLLPLLFVIVFSFVVLKQRYKTHMKKIKRSSLVE